MLCFVANIKYTLLREHFRPIFHDQSDSTEQTLHQTHEKMNTFFRSLRCRLAYDSRSHRFSPFVLTFSHIIR